MSQKHPSTKRQLTVNQGVNQPSLWLTVFHAISPSQATTSAQSVNRQPQKIFLSLVDGKKASTASTRLTLWLTAFWALKHLQYKWLKSQASTKRKIVKQIPLGPPMCAGLEARRTGRERKKIWLTVDAWGNSGRLGNPCHSDGRSENRNGSFPAIRRGEARGNSRAIKHSLFRLPVFLIRAKPGRTRAIFSSSRPRGQSLQIYRRWAKRRALGLSLSANWRLPATCQVNRRPCFARVVTLALRGHLLESNPTFARGPNVAPWAYPVSQTQREITQ